MPRNVDFDSLDSYAVKGCISFHFFWLGKCLFFPADGCVCVCLKHRATHILAHSIQYHFWIYFCRNIHFVVYGQTRIHTHTRLCLSALFRWQFFLSRKTSREKKKTVKRMKINKKNSLEHIYNHPIFSFRVLKRQKSYVMAAQIYF